MAHGDDAMNALTKVVKPRKIIDRKGVLTRLDELLSWSGYTPDSRNEVFAIYRDALEEGRAEVRGGHAGLRGHRHGLREGRSRSQKG